MLINKNLTLQAKKEVISNPLIVSCRESVMEHKTSFYGRFYIGPLELGQGLTLANALRRSLLSELSGLAITSVEIDGVSHEYSTLIGVRESVLDILLNLKQVVLKAKKSLRRPQTAYVYCQGPGVIRAGDILLPSSIQCVDPEQYIATLSSDGILKIKLIIRQGKNYLVQTPVSLDLNESSTTLILDKNKENSFQVSPQAFPFFSGFQKKVKKIKRLKIGKTLAKKNIDQLFLGKPKKLLGKNNWPHKNLFLSSLNKFVSRSAVLNSSVEYKIFLKNLYSTEKSKIGQFGSNKNKTLFLKNKKACLFTVKNYRSLNKIFENSKNKNWFINLFKKQILYILAIKLSKVNTRFSINSELNNFSAKQASSDNYTLINSLIKVVKYLENQPGTYCSNFKYFPQLNYYSLFSSLKSIISYTNYTKPLFIDAVFMPVTKVNYILEESKQKLFNDIYFNINNEFSKDSLNFDNFEQNVIKPVSLEQISKKKISKTNLERDGKTIKENYNINNFLHSQKMEKFHEEPKNVGNLFFGYNYWSLFCLDVTSKNKENFYSEFLFDQFNQSPKDIIILEIWTNGSILPRTALKFATKNLTNLLIKLQYAKIMKNSFFENKKTYIKTIKKLYEKYQSPTL